MGISASIASKKYQVPENAAQEDDHDSDLSTVDSFRPNSPWAHPQAYVGMPHGHIRTAHPQALGYHRYEGSLSRGSSTISAPPFHSMYEVRDFLAQNPGLLRNKKKKVKASELMLPMEQRQIKTKQGIYLGLINPPTIYGTGVNPYSNGRRLKVNQKLYLGLVYPTIQNSIQTPVYHETHRVQPPLKHPNEMIVVRRDAYNAQNPPKKKIRQRQPLPPPESKKSESRASSMPGRGKEMIVERVNLPFDQRSASLPRPVREIRASNDYVEPPDMKKGMANPRLPYTQRRGSHSKTNTLESRYSRNGLKSADSDVEITFNLDELKLQRRNGTSHLVQRQTENGSMRPAYFRKSLAYSPKYNSGPEMLSVPL